MNINQSNISFGDTYRVRMNSNTPLQEAYPDYVVRRTDRYAYVTPNEDITRLNKRAAFLADITSKGNKELAKERQNDIFQQLMSNEYENALDITV